MGQKDGSGGGSEDAVGTVQFVNAPPDMAIHEANSQTDRNRGTSRTLLMVTVHHIQRRFDGRRESVAGSSFVELLGCVRVWCV